MRPSGDHPRWARGAGLDTVIKVGFAVLLLALVTNASADADLWGHVRFGQDVLAAGRVVKADPYSFTSDREWVNHEWLAEVAMAAAWNAGGTAGLVGLKSLLLIGTLCLVGWTARRTGVSSWSAWLLVVVAAVGIVPRATTVRPQLFSLVLFAALALVLCEHRQRGRRWPLAVLPLMFGLWVNLHGGWLVGGGVLALWAVGQAIERRLPLADRVLLVGVGGLCLSATLVNPYGAWMWRFLYETVGLSRPHIADWKPVWSSAALIVPLACVTVVAALAIVRPSARGQVTRLVAVASLWCLALAVSRLDAFFSIAVSTFLAIPVAETIARWVPAPSPPGGTRRDLLGRAAINAVVLGALLIVAAGGMRSNASCLPFGDPVTAPEPDAVRFIRDHDLRGRVLTYYNYGEYAIWHLAPDVKVSMDGRRETVYSDVMVDAHFRFYAAPAQHAGFPDAIGADAVWLPNAFRGGPALEAAGWRPAFTGPVSTIWTRAAGATVPAESPLANRKRCFPGL